MSVWTTVGAIPGTAAITAIPSSGQDGCGAHAGAGTIPGIPAGTGDMAGTTRSGVPAGMILSGATAGTDLGMVPGTALGTAPGIIPGIMTPGTVPGIPAAAGQMSTMAPGQPLSRSYQEAALPVQPAESAPEQDAIPAQVQSAQAPAGLQA